MGNIIPKGTVFIITTGYNDEYHPRAICKALTDIDITDISDEYFANHPKQKSPDKFKVDKVIGWMINEKKYVERANLYELFLGPYATVEIL